MGKYASLEKDVFSVFAGASWKSRKINTYPSNYMAQDAGSDFIKVSVLPSGDGINLKSVSGVVLVDIYVQSGTGPARGHVLADELDSYLTGKSFSNQTGSTTQFFKSSLSQLGLDPDNQSLYRFQYTIPFSHFGVL
jgi:hypothetical protein